VPDAIAVLERASMLRGCGSFASVAFWPQMRFQLMQLYERAGRGPEAGAIRKELRNLLSLAEPTHVLRAALDREAAVAAAR
jgi:hypothetical protein